MQADLIPPVQLDINDHRPVPMLCGESSPVTAFEGFLLDIMADESDGGLFCSSFRLCDNMADSIHENNGATGAYSAIKEPSNIVASGVSFWWQVTDTDGKPI